MSREDGKRSWGDTFKAWLHPRAIAMLFLGFSAGITNSAYLFNAVGMVQRSGVDRSAVTFFSWAALGYSFKFLWAPLVDLLPLPVSHPRFGAAEGVAAGRPVASSSRRYVWMALIDPAGNQQNLTVMALAAVMLGFSSATQDIVIDAYRIEICRRVMQALLASMYIAGYRVGMLVAGAGSLFLAGYLGTTSAAYNYGAWRLTYLAMAAVMCCGVATTLLIKEPKVNRRDSHYQHTVVDYGRFLLFFLSAPWLLP